MVTLGLTPADTVLCQKCPSGEGFFCILPVARALGSDLPTLRPAGRECGMCPFSLPSPQIQWETPDGFLDILLHTFSGGLWATVLKNPCLLSYHHP